MEKKIDGHVHFHYPTDFVSRDLSSDILRMKEIGKSHGLDNFLGIFRRDDLNEIESFLEDGDIHPGLYIEPEDDRKSLEDFADQFKFAKIHSKMIGLHSQEAVDKKIDECAEAGLGKVQIHTDEIYPEFLDTIEKYSEGTGIDLYLVHGAGALYGLTASSDEEDIERLKEMEGVFLGTSTPGKIFDSGYLKEVEGFEDQLVYESDFTPSDRDFWYSSTIEEVEKSNVDPEKIFYENAKRFID
ncbi:MAG: hypothetical protein ACLFQ8_03540 [Candidatus Aenigmatarchaeota archaeon]